MELVEAVSSYRRFYNYERLHMSGGTVHRLRCIEQRTVKNSDLSAAKSCSESVGQDTMKASGHTSVQMHKRYLDLQREDIAKAFGLLQDGNTESEVELQVSDFAEGEGRCPVVPLVFKTSLGVVRSPEGSTPSLLRQENTTDRSRVSNFSRPYAFLKQHGLISEEVRNHQFRFKEIIDPDTNRYFSPLNTKLAACITRCSIA
jgi:hypothetical protein